MFTRLCFAMVLWSSGIFVACLASVGVLCAAEEDSIPTRVLLISSEPDHPWATHMYEHECKLLGKCLENTRGVQSTTSIGWPKDAKQLEGVKAIVFYCKHAGDILLDPVNRDQCMRLLKGGAGLTAIHWSTGADERYGPEYLELLGGWFNRAHSGLSTGKSWLTQADPKHPITRGWKEWEIRDEFYLNLRFAKATKPLLTVKVDGVDQVVGWTLERAGGGRAFGTTLGHFHDNFVREDFRRLLVNGILWTAHVDVPTEGANVKVGEEFIKLPPKPAGVK
jgi:type 1 glutamine amidotransferase